MANLLGGGCRRGRLQWFLVSVLLPIPSVLMAGGPALELPSVFIGNHGQYPPAERFAGRAGGFTVWFERGRIRIAKRGGVVTVSHPASQPVEPEPGGALAGRAHFLTGNDSARWTHDAPLYDAVVYRNLYPGVDLRYATAGGRLKSEYVVAPAADPALIRIRYQGAQRARVDSQGNLRLKTAAGEIIERAPSVYQEAAGTRTFVPARFVVFSNNDVRFEIGAYDRSRRLVIDPILSYSTYLGGAGIERATSVAVDSSGNAYITGYTDSTALATTAGAFQLSSAGGVDAFVLKLSPGGSSIVYWTFLGGSGDDRGFSIAVDSSGFAYVTGQTQSTNFPVVSAFRTTLSGNRDAFVTKLNTAGSGLVYSTYLGGGGSDSGYSIAVAPGLFAVVTGTTSSANFPLANAYDSTLGGASDAFVTRFGLNGDTVSFSSYLGGSGDERGTGIAADSSGFVYVSGTTTSTNFPTFSPFQASSAGGQDIFIAKLNVVTPSLLFGSYLGGSGAEFTDTGRSLAVDSAGGMYAAGRTGSTNFPVVGGYQTTLKGGTDCFVSKVSAAGALAFSTYLGGAGPDACTAVAVDSSNRVYVAGYTASPDFPQVNPTQASFGGVYDAFLSKLNSVGSVLMESTFHGGADNDAAYGLALDSGGAAYVVGQTASSNFPLLSPAQSVISSVQDGFASRFAFQGPPATVSVNPSSGTSATQSFSFVYSDPLGFGDLGWTEAGVNSSSSKVGACYVRYDAAANTLSLYNDAGAALTGSLTPGTGGSLENSQCLINNPATAVSGAGNNLTVTVPVSFRSGFSGAKSVFLQAASRGGDQSTLDNRGSWTVPSANQAPVSLSVSPTAGSATTQTFTFKYFEANGATDIRWTEMAVATALTSVGTCYLHYDRAANTIQLANDAGSDWVGTKTLAAAGTLQNSQCTVDAGASSASNTSGTLTVNLNLTFRAIFGGSKNVFMQALDLAGAAAGWSQMGTFTVIAPNEAPAPVSVTPSSGSGSGTSFTFAYTDPNGFTDIRWTEMAFGTSLTPVASCYLHLDRVTGNLQLANDAGSDWVGTKTLGTVTSLQNSQCSIDLSASMASGSANSLTVTLTVTFKASFAGAKSVFMQALDMGGLPAGWFAKGSYTAVPSGLDPPVPISATPSSGSGTTQTFTFVYSDPAGYTNIRWVEAAINTVLTSVNSCYIHYDRITNLIQVANNPGTDWAGSAVMGSPATVQNSQCSVSATFSSASGSGNNFTVNLRITFLAGFSGAKTTYMQALNNSGVAAGWQVKGTWTVP